MEKSTWHPAYFPQEMHPVLNNLIELGTTSSAFLNN